MKGSLVLRYFGWIFLLCAALPAHAALNIEIIGAGEHQIPVAIVPFAGEGKFAQSISQVVSADLARSGLFRLVDPAGKAPHEPREVVYTDWPGVDALAIGSVEEQINGRVAVKFRLLDTVKQTELVGQAVSGKADQRSRSPAARHEEERRALPLARPLRA